MSRPRPRSPSVEPAAKKAKTTHVPSVIASFQHGLLEQENALILHGTYIKSKPFKYAVIDKLFQDDLLVKVRPSRFGKRAGLDKIM